MLTLPPIRSRVRPRPEKCHLRRKRRGLSVVIASWILVGAAPGCGSDESASRSHDGGSSGAGGASGRAVPPVESRDPVAVVPAVVAAAMRARAIREWTDLVLTRRARMLEARATLLLTDHDPTRPARRAA